MLGFDVCFKDGSAALWKTACKGPGTGQRPLRRLRMNLADPRRVQQGMHKPYTMKDTKLKWVNEVLNK